MSNIPKVSVAIITYNQEEFIRSTLDSVIEQNYPNLEIVVADDASSDDTPRILREYAENNPNVFKLILSDTNAGITKNCNKAYRECSGKYIAWLGGDDLFYKGKLAAQVAAMEDDSNCDLSYHAVRVFDSNSGSTIEITNTKDVKRRNLEQVLLDGISLPGSSVMVRTSSCPSDGFDESIPVASDWLFFLETMLFGYAVRVEGVYGGYRIHSNNATQKSLFADMQKSLSKLRILRPDIFYAVDKAEAIIALHEGRKSLFNLDVRSARKIFWHGVKLDPRHKFIWVWLMLSIFGGSSVPKLRKFRKSLATVRS